MPQRVTLLAHTGTSHTQAPHTDAPAALVFLLNKVIEPVQQLSKPVTGRRGARCNQ